MVRMAMLAGIGGGRRWFKVDAGAGVVLAPRASSSPLLWVLASNDGVESELALGVLAC